MNRLILLGNGFDLAHKMKTSYYDFIFDYLSSSFETAFATDLYEDDLIRITIDYGTRTPSFEEMASVKDLLIFEVNEAGTRFHRSLPPKYAGVRLLLKNQFISHILKNCGDCNWVNIENEYYRFLIMSLDNRGAQVKIGKLNDTMTFLIKQINKYFAKQKSEHLINGYNEILRAPFSLQDFINTPPFDGRLRYPTNTLILSFNYTHTIRNYNLSGNIEVIPIHGLADSEENPIIFGFGDEMDDHYKSIEAQTANRFLRYVKSFGYFRTSNYHNLSRFIDSDKFQVFILGHSCGLSDRTMLNMIFEHKNCESIKIFYHESENHFRILTEDISRHFSNKSAMRRKIVPFDKSERMPQAK